MLSQISCVTIKKKEFKKTHTNKLLTLNDNISSSKGSHLPLARNNPTIPAKPITPSLG